LAASLAAVASDDWSATFGSFVESGATGVELETLEILVIGRIPADVRPSVAPRKPIPRESIR
jgi:hypothetical protein